MNASRRAARAGRNLLIALVVGAVIIVAIVVAYVLGRNTSVPVAGPTPGVTSTHQAAASGEGSDAAPTGCLGGPARDSEMVLTAQRDAPESTYGAVEVAAAFFRWTYQSPHPSSADIVSATSIFVPKDATAARRDLEAAYERNPNPSKGVVEDGKSFHLATAGAQWTVQAGEANGQKRVNIMAPYVVDDAVSPTKTAAGAFDMEFIDSRWRVVGLAEADPKKLAAGGTAFSAGC